jgi:hypothetical protein
MIFTSLGILVASLGFLIAGIVRSSIPLLVVSLIGTAGAAFLLLATADLARQRSYESAGPPPAAPAGVDQPLLGYDDMTADQISKLISSGALTDEQILAVRRYERANAARKTVLDRMDRALLS